MSLGSILSLVAGLALVLGLLALLVRLTKHLRPGLLSRSGGPSLEVLSRMPLAPRQGVAVVRFQDQLLLLSYGEGGIRLLKEELEELDDLHEEVQGATGKSDPDLSVAGALVEAGKRSAEAPSFPNVWNRIRKVAGIGSTALLLLFGPGGTGDLSAQNAGGVDVPDLSGVSAPAGTEIQDPVQEAPTGEESAPAPEVDALSPAAAVFGVMNQLPSMDLQIGSEGEEGLRLSGPVGTVLFMGFLTLLPTLLLMMTGFTRILVVLHLLKQAIGTQTAPPTHLLTAMALILTGFVMAPTLAEVNRTALDPWRKGELDELQMVRTASIPFRDFMVGSTREDDLLTFLEMHGSEPPSTVEEIPMVVVTSAFVTSELRHAFQMGFALFLPFVVIDIVVASVLMSMGMFMLPPVMVSLPFKLLLFVLVDGWSLILGGLVRSFA